MEVSPPDSLVALIASISEYGGCVVGSFNRRFKGKLPTLEDILANGKIEDECGASCLKPMITLGICLWFRTEDQHTAWFFSWRKTNDFAITKVDDDLYRIRFSSRSNTAFGFMLTVCVAVSDTFPANDFDVDMLSLAMEGSVMSLRSHHPILTVQDLLCKIDNKVATISDEHLTEILKDDSLKRRFENSFRGWHVIDERGRDIRDRVTAASEKTSNKQRIQSVITQIDILKTELTSIMESI
jgi:hypothetical protein